MYHDYAIFALAQSLYGPLFNGIFCVLKIIYICVHAQLAALCVGGFVLPCLTYNPWSRPMLATRKSRPGIFCNFIKLKAQC